MVNFGLVNNSVILFKTVKPKALLLRFQVLEKYLPQTLRQLKKNDLYDGSYIEQMTVILSHEHYYKPNLHILTCKERGDRDGIGHIYICMYTRLCVYMSMCTFHILILAGQV